MDSQVAEGFRAHFKLPALSDAGLVGSRVRLHSGWSAIRLIRLLVAFPLPPPFFFLFYRTDRAQQMDFERHGINVS